MRLPIYFNVHLVSDSTGETLNAIMRASTALFGDVEPVEHNYYLVRSQRQLERVMGEIESAPGIVFYTISNGELRETLEHHCRKLGVPALSVLDNAINMLSRYLGLQTIMRTAGQHTLDANYFRRMEAINFALSHDDGQGNLHLSEADVVLVGVSRTSKTPTCVYLANRGVRAANVPLVPGIDPPEELFALDPTSGPLIVGLKISVERLLQIRHARLMAMQDNAQSDYADEEQVRLELRDALRLFDRQKWPVLDVSRRSVEETAAAILNLLTKRKAQ
jgi:regulator of PEP synthase PpsR (kinase-PPPase family)